MYHRLRIQKSQGTWYAELYAYVLIEWEFQDQVTSDNYGDLMIEVANKGWIDLINNNPKE